MSRDDHPLGRYDRIGRPEPCGPVAVQSTSPKCGSMLSCADGEPTTGGRLKRLNHAKNRRFRRLLEVGLAAALSNSETAALYQRLTKRDWRQVKRAATKPRDRARDGKLKFGTVIGALLQVLTEADTTLRFIEIHAGVEALLGFPVSRSSVKQLLSAEAGRRTPRFERVARGRYRLK